MTIYIAILNNQCYAFRDKKDLAGHVGVSTATISRRLKTTSRTALNGYAIYATELTPSQRGGLRTKNYPSN